jgi:hypothetical protein
LILIEYSNDKIVQYSITLGLYFCIPYSSGGLSKQYPRGGRGCSGLGDLNMKKTNK